MLGNEYFFLIFRELKGFVGVGFLFDFKIGGNLMVIEMINILRKVNFIFGRGFGWFLEGYCVFLWVYLVFCKERSKILERGDFFFYLGIVDFFWNVGWDSYFFCYRIGWERGEVEVVDF